MCDASVGQLLRQLVGAEGLIPDRRSAPPIPSFEVNHIDREELGLLLTGRPLGCLHRDGAAIGRERGARDRVETVDAYPPFLAARSQHDKLGLLCDHNEVVAHVEALAEEAEVDRQLATRRPERRFAPNSGSARKMPYGNVALGGDVVGTIPVGVGVTVFKIWSAALGTGVGTSSTASPPQPLASKVDTSVATTIAATFADSFPEL